MARKRGIELSSAEVRKGGQARESKQASNGGNSSCVKVYARGVEVKGGSIKWVPTPLVIACSKDAERGQGSGEASK